MNREFDEFVVDYGFEQAADLAYAAEVEYNLTGDFNSIVMLLQPQDLFFDADEAFVIPYDIDRWDVIISQNAASNDAAVRAIMRYELDGLGNSAEFDSLLERYYWAQAYVDDPNSFNDFDSFDYFVDESIVYLADASFHIQYSSDNSNLNTQLSHDMREYSVSIADWDSGETVGYIFVESSADFADENSGFIEGTLYTSVTGGLLTAVFALGIGAWLSRRISNPIQALTAAATRVAESGSTEQLPVESDDELGQMSAAFNHMTTSLAAQQKIRQQLIADVSHELNTPLSIMRLEAQGMADGMQTPEEAAVNIQREIDLLRNLVNDLELVAESDRNAIRLQKTSVDVTLFLREVLARWQPKAAAQGVELRLVAGELGSAEFDPDRVRQILGNLLRNALQHSEAGGRVVISAETTSTALQLSIRDNGDWHFGRTSPPRLRALLPRR